MRPLRTVPVVLLSLGLVLSGCGGSSKKSSSSSATAPAAAPNTITIKNFAFSPDPVKVSAGATVTVTNKDTTAHTVTSDDRTSFDTKHVDGGKSATFTAPSKAGTYKYHCAIHQYMTASLVVQ